MDLFRKVLAKQGFVFPGNKEVDACRSFHSQLSEAGLADASSSRSYLGSAYLALLLLLIIMDVCQWKPSKRVNALLISVSTAAFLLAASADGFGLYYQSVDLVTINGMTRLVKEYGPLHILYPVYLLSYFISMIVVIVRSFRKKTLSSPKYAVFLAAAVLLNIGVWRASCAFLRRAEMRA